MASQVASTEASIHNPYNGECFGKEKSFIGIDINDHCGPYVRILANLGRGGHHPIEFLTAKETTEIVMAQCPRVLEEFFWQKKCELV